MKRRIAIFACLVVPVSMATGCAGGSGNGLFAAFSAHDDDAGDVEVSEAQACAIGYDLARAIHERVSLRRVVIVAPGHATPCERHALDYLRRGGFRIDETGQGGVSLDIELSRAGGEAILAIATLGGDLRIARSYMAVATGVIANGPVSVQHLNADTYAPREGAPRGGAPPGGAPRPDTYGGAS